MRPLNFFSLNNLADVIRALRQIETASREDIETVADAFTVSGSFTDTRELNVSAPSTANIAAVLATFLSDLKARGSTRT